MQIDLNSEERTLIMVALTCDQIKSSIREPATPKKVRDVWKTLLEKLKRDQKLHNDLAGTIEGKVVLAR